MKNVTQKFKALSDANRIRILKMLAVKPLCVCEITEILGLATSTVSKHLSILKDTGFITDEKCGKWVNYHLRSRSDNGYSNELMPLINQWLNDNDLIVQDKKKIDAVDREVICSR